MEERITIDAANIEIEAQNSRWVAVSMDVHKQDFLSLIDNTITDKEDIYYMLDKEDIKRHFGLVDEE